MHKVVFVRHGKTSWATKFQGWTDIDVLPEGIVQTKLFAPRIKDAGFVFDIAFTSFLKRSIRTLWNVLDVIDQMYIPIVPAWELNERHYGALQGLNKAETAIKYGDEQLNIWRRSFDTPPPALDINDERHPSKELKYNNVDRSLLPCTESLKDTIKRTVPYWNNVIVPRIASGKQVIISAHGNSMRAIVKEVEKMSDQDIMKVDIPYSIPLVYEFDDQMNFSKKYYLASDEEVDKVIQEIKNQGKAK